MPLDVFGLLFSSINFSGPIMGAIRETQEMLNFCGEHNVTADIEMMGTQQINQSDDRC